MLVPRHWKDAEGSATDPSGKRHRLRVWGWSGSSAAEALAVAQRRLSEVVARIARGEFGRAAYLYGLRPLREEIVRTLGKPDTPSEAVVTRNRYGALVLNTAHVPFIDVDAPAASSGALARLARLFGRRSEPEDPALERVREACRGHAGDSFRLYRTRAGYRVLATDLSLDPRADATQEFLAGFGADPAFRKLCKLQGSFRARLTPKPWRCGAPLPPGSFPREDREVEDAFQAWRAAYESSCNAFAACRYVESIGPGRIGSHARAIVDEHDRSSRALSDLPLA